MGGRGGGDADNDVICLLLPALGADWWRCGLTVAFCACAEPDPPPGVDNVIFRCVRFSNAKRGSFAPRVLMMDGGGTCFTYLRFLRGGLKITFYVLRVLHTQRVQNKTMALFRMK